MTKRNLDQNGHHFNFDTEKCVHCGMTFNKLDDAGMPQCRGMASDRASHSGESSAGNPRRGVRDG